VGEVMTACIQSVAMFGSELWWKGNSVVGTIERAEELQILVNRQGRAVTGCFRLTNMGALAMESGLRPAAAQLENRRRRFGLRLLSLPQGNQAKEVVGARSGIGKRRKNALAHRGRTETTVLLEEPEALDAKTMQEDEKMAKAEAERTRPGLTMFTDGSRLGSGATGWLHASMIKQRKAEQPGTPSYGRMVNPGWASRPMWARIKKPTTRSTLH
jgi:hypothetical protein